VLDERFFESTRLPAAGKAPALGRTLFESRGTLEWARANIIRRSGKISMRDEVIEVSLPAGSQAEMLLPAGTLHDTWAELQFGVAPDSGIFDVLFHEAVVPESHCLRVDPRQGIVGLGLVPAGGRGEARWLGARKTALPAGTEHSLLLLTSGQCIDVFLDGAGLLSVQDGTVTHGIARLRMLPSGDGPSTLRLKRIAVYRPPG
jgi:hypothetical protein